MMHHPGVEFLFYSVKNRCRKGFKQCLPATRVLCKENICLSCSSMADATAGAFQALVKMQGLILRLQTPLVEVLLLLVGNAPGQCKYNFSCLCYVCTKSEGRNPIPRKILPYFSRSSGLSYHQYVL